MNPAERSAANSPISSERLDELIAGLSIEEKAGLMAGIDAWHAGGAPSIGLEPTVTLDGPNGVRGMTFPAGSTATCTPCGTALGATWDVDLVTEVAARIGLEAKRAGVHYMLGPVLNLVRSPLGGRDFEAYSEDPVLAALLGAAYVEGMQSAGVAATPKHYVANESETHRTTVDCRVDERTLREVYLVPFQAAVNAGAWSMMAAYNRVNGVHCSHHGPLVGGILKGEWAWDGVLMSDWEATHDTVAGAVAGLDLEMPGPPRFFGPALAEAVRRGDVSEAVLDDPAGTATSVGLWCRAHGLDRQLTRPAAPRTPLPDDRVAGRRPRRARRCARMAGSVRRQLAEDLAGVVDDRLAQRQVAEDVVRSGGQLVEVVAGVAGASDPGVGRQCAPQGRVELGPHGLVDAGVTGIAGGAQALGDEHCGQGLAVGGVQRVVGELDVGVGQSSRRPQMSLRLGDQGLRRVEVRRDALDPSVREHLVNCRPALSPRAHEAITSTGLATSSSTSGRERTVFTNGSSVPAQRCGLT